MKTKSFVPPPGSRVISFHPNGRAQSEGLAKRQLKRVMGKTRRSKAENEEELQQLDADWEIITHRKTLTPKTKLKRVSDTTQLFEVPWPDVHAEMDLNELITARVSLAVKLAGIFEEQHISFYKDADSACTALSVAITTLQRLAMSISNQQKDSIWFLQFVSATTHMKYAVELLTCKMLDPTSPQHCQRGGGPFLLRIHTGSHWKSIENKISKEVQGVQALVIIGDMLITGFKSEQWEFVRGVLETIGVFRSAKGSDGDSDVRQICLLTKAHCLKRIEKREDIYKDSRMHESRAQALVNTPLPRLSCPYANIISVLQQNYYAPLTSSEDLAASRLLSAVSGSLPAILPHTNRSNLSTHSYNKQLNMFSASDCTGSDLVLRNSIKHKGLKCLRERANTHYRETGAHEDSDSSADGDETGEINKKSEPRKRSKLNPDRRLLADPEPGPSSQETPEMRRVRMEIEGVHIYEEKIVTGPKEFLVEGSMGRTRGELIGRSKCSDDLSETSWSRA